MSIFASSALLTSSPPRNVPSLYPWMTPCVRRKYTALPSRECHSTSVIGRTGSTKEDDEELALPTVVCAEKREWDSRRRAREPPNAMKPKARTRRVGAIRGGGHLIGVGEHRNKKPSPFEGRGWGEGSYYFAISSTRRSRITLTLITPGYVSSCSTFFAISFARRSCSKSLIFAVST